MLRIAIITETVTPEMDPWLVWQMKEEYQKWPFDENWARNLSNLHTYVERDIDRMTQDLADYENDLYFIREYRVDFPRAPSWHLSKARVSGLCPSRSY